MKRPVVCFFGIDEVPADQFQDQDVMTIHCYPNDQSLAEIMTSRQPDVLITIGSSWKPFQRMSTSDYSVRRRWLHYQNLDQVPLRQLFFCYVSNLSKGILSHPVDKKPLVSFFTPSYKSGHKIQRPFRSLKAQTYPYWEWIIVNDSPDELSSESLVDPVDKPADNWELLKSLKAQDARIRIYQSDQNIANIGQLKYESASLARGQILVELDHDDDLTVDCLAKLVGAFDQYPEAGFAYTDFAELYEDTLVPFQYGSRWAFGYGGYYAQMLQVPGITNPVLTYVATSVNLNMQTIRNIVGVPNHIRAWRASFYRDLGGHLPMAVADDYELLVRTFLKTRMVHIPYMGYFQYRNQSGNTTFRRNALITMLQGIAKEVHEPAIQARLIELSIDKQPECHQPPKRLWEQAFNYHEPHASLIYRAPEAADTISVVMATYKRPGLLRRALDSVLAQTYKDLEILLVGDHCPDLDVVIKDYQHDSRVRWWNLQESYNDGGATPRNYALRMMLRTPWVTYLDDDNYWLPGHLESLFKAIKTPTTAGPARFALASFIMYQDPETIEAGTEPFEYTVICREPKRYRLDTSSFLHQASLLTEYGYWKPLPEVGRAHDWDLVSRWLGVDYHGTRIRETSEPWVATEKATLVYRVVPRKMNARGIYDFYNDQIALPVDSLGNQPRLINFQTKVETRVELSVNETDKVETNEIDTKVETDKVETKVEETLVETDTIENKSLKNPRRSRNKKTTGPLTTRGSQVTTRGSQVTTRGSQEIHSFCITTLHCQDREPIFALIESVIANTSVLDRVVPWIILAQGCTQAHLDRLSAFLAKLEVSWLEFQIKIVADNLGCSKGHDLLAELAKNYHYVLLLEDDWICQPQARSQAPMSWLKTCLAFLDTNPQVSTLFLRHYVTEEEKRSSGWGRHIPYKCHRKSGNFNYRTKLRPETIQNINGIKFQQIPNFLFTFNPCIRRNPDYYRVGVFPLDVCDDRSAKMGGWQSENHQGVATWGWSEALAQEKTYDLFTYNVARGLFSHYEHLMAAESFLQKA